MENIRVALVHDWLTGQRGGEKVLEVLSEIFPKAPIYTLFHFSGTQIPTIEEKTIRTSFIQNLPLLKKRYRYFLPLYPMAVEHFDLQEFDLIISSSHCVAKGAIPRPDALHISYVHSPVRYAWNQYFVYFPPEKLGLFSRFIIPPLIHYLRMWDVTSSQRVDYYVANSKAVAQRINKYYRRTAEVIYPPVDIQFFQPSDQQEDYYLIVSALVPYKRIDLAIHAFNECKIPLKIVGVGPDYKKLKKEARANIQFLGTLDSSDLLAVYQKARALLIPGEEDFGINSIEAQACGVPVVAYGRGGATETVIPGKTGVFFNLLNHKSIHEALDKFQSMDFNKSAIRTHALNFSRERFKNNMRDFIKEKWENFRSLQ